MKPRLTWNSQYTCFSLPNAGITDLYHQAQQRLTLKSVAFKSRFPYPHNGRRGIQYVEGLERKDRGLLGQREVCLQTDFRLELHTDPFFPGPPDCWSAVVILVVSIADELIPS
jgi:hypothetical protein